MHKSHTRKFGVVVFVAALTFVTIMFARRGTDWLSVITVASAADTSQSDMDGQGIFRRFRDDDGKLQSARAFNNLNANNTFFQPFGTNQQTCATCHVPSDGYTIHVQTIEDIFERTHGNDPLFRPNDTANRPDASPSSHEDFEEAYSLLRELGVMRISEVVPKTPDQGGTAEFVVAPQNTTKFGPLPNLNDPQHKGSPAISLFRRPLVTSNMRFNSAVLWDGRADIRNIQKQVDGAAKTLLLATAPTPAQEDDVARFMLGVFTDQVIDDRSSIPQSFAGNTAAQGALGGVKNLLAFAFNPKSPCLHDNSPAGALTKSLNPIVTYFPNDGPGTLTPSTCTPVVQGGPNMTTFQAWLNIPGDGKTATSRRQIAHGEEIFNTAVLHVPSDIVIPGLTGNEAHCTTCHATNNIGNHPDAKFFVRIGSDSVKILDKLADEHPEEPSLQDFVKRTKILPQYCLRSTKAGAPSLAVMQCGNYHGDSNLGIPGDVVTSDPGRAMQTGKWEDIGRFKPPILRGLAPRSPYFHGSAADSTTGIVDFYNARFNIGLSQTEKDDLVRFLESH